MTALVAPRKRICVVEDDDNIRTGLCDNLDFEGYAVESFSSAEALLSYLDGKASDFQVYLLDISLPGSDGLQLAGRLREKGIQDPILFLTARSSETDKLKGFQSGADDYLTKPFSVKELLARLQAILRRTHRELPAVHRFGHCEVDFKSLVFRCNGEEQDLTRTEFSLLKLLVENNGVVLPRETLLSKVWGYNPGFDTRTVDVHIHNLRRKLEPTPESPKHIQTVRGVGYKFNA